MRTIFAYLMRIFAAIFLLAVAFWPDYGLAYLLVDTWSQAPALWVTGIALWLGALALNLPLSVNTFRTITTCSILAMFGAALWTLYNSGHFAVDNWDGWIITGIVVGGTVIGWWTVSTPLHRWYRNIFVVEDNSGE